MDTKSKVVNNIGRLQDVYRKQQQEKQANKRNIQIYCCVGLGILLTAIIFI